MASEVPVGHPVSPGSTTPVIEVSGKSGLGFSGIIRCKLVKTAKCMLLFVLQ